MNNKKNELQVVSFEQAKKLKELEFDYPCGDFYEIPTKTRFDLKKGNPLETIEPLYKNSSELMMFAPSIQLALKWLRQEQDVDIWITHYANTIFYQFSFIHRSGEISGDFESGAFDDYEEAETEALDYALDYLNPVDDGHL